MVCISKQDKKLKSPLNAGQKTPAEQTSTAPISKNGRSKITTNEKKTPHPTDVHVGSKIRERRRLLGWSQTKLGEAVGVTFQQIQKYERGTNRIGASRLLTIAMVLDVYIGFFFPSDDAKTCSPAYTDRLSLELIKVFAEIKDKDARKFGVRLIRKLAKGLRDL